MLDDPLLLAAEAGIAEDAAQHAERGVRGSGSLTGVGVELCCTACGWLYAAADAGKPYARSGARMHEIAQAFLLVYAGLFPIVNPVGSAPIFLALTASHTERVRHDLARRVAVNGFVLLLGSLFVGSHVLQFFGITIPVLRVGRRAGGGVFGWRLLRDGASRPTAAGEVGEDGPVDAFYPLTMPLTVGPGSIAVAIALGAQRPRRRRALSRVWRCWSPAPWSVSRRSRSTVFFCYRFADRMVAVLGPNGINVLIRLSAFILLCIGIQIIWSGYSALIADAGTLRPVRRSIDAAARKCRGRMDDRIDPDECSPTTRTGSRSASRCRARKTRCCCAARGITPTTSTCPARPIAVIVRSHYAHGVIRGIDTAAARAMPGVLAVYTAADLAAGGIGPLPPRQVMNNRDGTPMLSPVRHALATDKVRHVGEAVAAVDRRDARRRPRTRPRRSIVDIDPLPAVTEPDEAAAPGAPQLYDDVPRQCRARFPFRRQRGGRRRLRRAPRMSRGSSCATTASSSTRWSRAPRSPNTTREREHWTLHVGCQGVFGFRNYIAGVLGVGRDKVRVLTDRVGGSFGMKQPTYAGVLLHPARGARARPPGQMDRRALRQLCLRHAWPRRTR